MYHTESRDSHYFAITQTFNYSEDPVYERLLEPKHRFGAEFQISLAMPQLWQAGDTYRIACLNLKKTTAYSRDAKVDARDKDKG